MGIEDKNELEHSVREPNSDTIPKIDIEFIRNNHEVSIIGNKIGLQKFSKEILEAAERIEELEKLDETNPEKSILIALDYNVHERGREISVRPFPKTITRENGNKISFGDTIAKYGCVTVIFIIIVSFVVGIVTIIRWF